jgi:hypothetical protein
MGLFDLVKQHHAVRSAADRLGQLTAFLKADIAGRRAEQAADGVLLLVLAHVNAHHGVLIVEQEFCQGACQLGLADAGWPQEDERPDRAVGVLQASPGAPDGVGDHFNGLVLPDDALVQAFFHAHQLLHFALQEA